MLRFGLIGGGGYVAPKHMAAIKDLGGKLVAVMDKNDSVGIIDNFFPEADFFTEFERFDRHLDKLRRRREGIDFLSICTPNYLHDAHIRFGLRNSANVICEKPLVLNPWNIDGLIEIEKETGKEVFSILQLRNHPDFYQLKNTVARDESGKKYDIDITYLTARGKWYLQSWKGQIEKSGGIATNIGVHFFDFLTWVFGEAEVIKVHLDKPDSASGYLEFKKARVRWFLSIKNEYLSLITREKESSSFRSIKIDGNEIEFSSSFSDLHKQSYNAIIHGRGIKLNEVRNSIEIVYKIRNSETSKLKGDYHPLLKIIKID